MFLVFVGTSECFQCSVFTRTSNTLCELSCKQNIGQFALSVALQSAVRPSAEEEVIKVYTT